MVCPPEAMDTIKKGGKKMAKPSGGRGSGKGSNRGAGKSGNRGAGGWPAKTGQRSGGGRNNAPSKGKCK